jgi:hypothetical protein
MWSAIGWALWIVAGLFVTFVMFRWRSQVLNERARETALLGWEPRAIEAPYVCTDARLGGYECCGNCHDMEALIATAPVVAIEAPTGELPLDPDLAELGIEYRWLVDPLGAWVISRTADVDAQPVLEFDAAWNALIARGALTGIGADVETEWQSWNLVSA